MSKAIDTVDCPALVRIIDIGYCQELQMATDDAITWDGIEDQFNSGQKSICQNCIKRSDPSK